MGVTEVEENLPRIQDLATQIDEGEVKMTRKKRFVSFEFSVE